MKIRVVRVTAFVSILLAFAMTAHANPSMVRGPCVTPDPGLNNAEAFGAEVFARGEFNDWAAAPETRFLNQGNNVYTATFAMEPGAWPFKIASEDWSIEYANAAQPVVVGETQVIGLAAGGSPNDSIGIPEAGCYQWQVTVIDDTSVPAPFFELLVVLAGADQDGDGIDDLTDNCPVHPNPTQSDTNNDGIGNACDPDLNNDGIVDFNDLAILRVAFYSNPGDPAWNPDADFNDDGEVDFNDLMILKEFLFGVPGIPGPGTNVDFFGTAAHWVSRDTLLWTHGADVTRVQLLYSADGSIREVDGALTGADLVFELTPGTAPDLPGARHIENRTPYRLAQLAVDAAAELVKGQLVVVGLNNIGNQLEATAVQFPLALDDIYASAAADATLGVTYNGSAPAFAIWAPTSTSAALNLYDAPTDDTPSATVPMTFDASTGIWHIDGTSDWDRKYFTLALNNYAPAAAGFVDVEVTDPYSVSLSAADAGPVVKSQFVNLDDADLKPTGWDNLVKPPLEAPEDIVIYELHVRDFSALDASSLPVDQGNYTAFADDTPGTTHLAALAAAGLTHVHLLPAFDIASVNEDEPARVDLLDPIEDLCAVQPAAATLCQNFAGSTILEVLESFGPADSMQSQIVEWLRGLDSFNWGYDPVHFNVPEGSYSSNANGVARVLEFRTMVKGLADLGLRTILDQVYNHTTASGHVAAKSVFDKVVPGYYHRRDPDTGGVLRESCCDDTAAEHAMMDKFIVDSAVHWAREYKIDGLRLDLMSLHPLSTMEKTRDALAALTLETDGVDGSTLYLYGEGWSTGVAAGDIRFFSSRQNNLRGTGIGSFNDRIRDAVRGGGPFDSGLGHVASQGFISGQFYDPNSLNTGSSSERDALLSAADRIRAALAGALSVYPLVSATDADVTAGQLGAGYTGDPQEIVNYIASHDGETLWDIAQYKHPIATTTADRVRAHVLGNALVLLGQGVAFLQAGQDLLRSKSMDRNSFDAGDWFNRLDFTLMDNNFAKGLPLPGDNGASLSVIDDVLAIGAADPGPTDIAMSAELTQELLRIRKSSRLFRLRTGGDVVSRLNFYNTGSAQVEGMIVMGIDGCVDPEFTPEYGSVVVVFNARTDAQVFELFTDRAFMLHPEQMAGSSVDPVVGTAFHDAQGFHVPARTTAVFVEAQSGAMCSFGAGWDDTIAFVSGEFNDNAFVNALVPVGNTHFVETSVSMPVGMDQRYRIQSADLATINCGGPGGGGPLLTPVGTTTSFVCGGSPEPLTVDVAEERRYKVSVDRVDNMNPSLVIRPQTGSGFPVDEGPCGIVDPGNDNGALFGRQMFVRGNFTNWTAQPPYDLYNMGDGTFQAEFELDTGGQVFKVADADWSLEYGGPPNPMALGVTQTVPRGVGPGNDILLTTPETGCYSFTVEPSAQIDPADNAPATIDLTVQFKPGPTGEPTAPPLVRGSFNDWSESDPMEATGPTTFERIVNIGAPGPHEFRIASSDLATVNCGGPQDLDAAMTVPLAGATTISCGESPVNLSIDIPLAGAYLVTVNAANRANPTLQFDSFLGAGFNSQGIGQPTVFVKGDFNAFGLDNPMTASGGGTRYFSTVSLAAGVQALRFESGDSTTISCGAAAGGAAAPIGTSMIRCGLGLPDIEVTVPATGNYRFFLQTTTPGSTFEPQLTITQL